MKEWSKTLKDRYLFRGKRTDNRKWVKGFLVSCEMKVPLNHLEENHRPTMIEERPCGVYDAYKIHEIDPDTICQCTGYKGIYEHDIIRSRENEVYEIRWSDESLGWVAVNVNSSDSIPLGEFCPEEIVVIGNGIDGPGLYSN